MNSPSSARPAPLVIVGMSGGVDSSVAALLLLRQGYRVEGLFMKNWDEDDGTRHCTAAEDLICAAGVCERLGIELHDANFAGEYRRRVFENFLTEQRRGRTPNPDVLCNREIKFEVFAEHARRLGADYIATGHYARLRRGRDGLELLRGLDDDKDQSYFLHAVPAERLAPALFPLGELRKSQVRALARDAGFANCDRPDSVGICFIGERPFAQFLERYLPPSPGAIVDVDGAQRGRHLGLWRYTIGQRRGIGVGGDRDADAAPWYVVDKDVAGNRLIIAQGQDHPALFKDALEADAERWVAGRRPPLPRLCQARLRHRQRVQPCQVEAVDEQRLRVRFQTPQRAVTPGQAVVFYDDERCLGGAVIHRGCDSAAVQAA